MSARHILVVDDSPFTGEAIAWALRKAGFGVDVARDLWDLERDDLAAPDLVLMDVVLQEAYGDDLAPLLRASRGFECPILLMSSLPDAELEQRAADAGVEGFVSKRGGLAGIVARVRAELGREPGPALATGELTARFDTSTRQRVRRVVHVAASAEHWNAPAIAAEMQALAGDADLVGADALAQAARTAREAAQQHGAIGPSPAVQQAIAKLAKLGGGGELPVAGKLLVIDGTTFSRDHLLTGLDRAGYVVVEAATLVEARQKLRAVEYDLVIVETSATRSEPALARELAQTLPDVPVAMLGDEPHGERTLVKSAGEQALLDAIGRLVAARG